MNLAKYDEWKDTDAVEVAIRFLDAVIQEYIDKSEGVPGLEASRRSAIKGRAVGLGVLGWHTYLQNKMIPFDSFTAMSHNNLIFKKMRESAEKATKELARELGEPEWCKGFDRRNTHLLAQAPTVSNSLISGGHSPGIEPIAANLFSQKSAKGTFIRKSPTLEALLETRGKNTVDVWKQINEQNGSVQGIKCLTDEEKMVFLTAREINQHAIIKQAAQRQKYIDQGQSVNLFFAANSAPKYIHEVHWSAWELGLKSLYYLRTEGVLKGDLASRSKEECAACEA
jgi:ribonucleoside-diphosphate reductase alpha chain